MCGIEKSESDFYKDRSHPDGLEYRCKQCFNEVRKKRISANVSLVNEHRSKCEKCGEDRFYLIDFHHINPSDKSFTIGDCKYSVKRMLLEIKKCVCLCKNCHWEFHYLYGKNPENPSAALREYLSK